MKNKIISLFLPLLPVLAFAGGPSPAETLRHYLKSRDYFKLRQEFSREEKSLSVRDRLYFEAFIDNSFNRCERSSAAVGKLLSAYREVLPDSVTIALMQLQIDNQVKTYRYAAAAATGDRLLNNYRKSIDSAKLADIKNSNILWRALANVGPQQVIRLQNTTVAWKRDTAGLMNIPVGVGGVINNFVFDTGANLSTISQSYARQLHLQLTEASFDLGGVTSVTNKASLAIARSLLVGNTEIRNVVFLVLPDEQLSFPQIHYKINAIIGYPVISQLGEVTIRQNGTISIPAEAGKSNLQNLAMDGLLPVLAMKTGNDTLSYSFDTGAKQTMFFKLYLDRYRAEVERTGKPDSINMGGAGGMMKYKAFRLPAVNLYPAGKAVQLRDIDVLTTPVSENSEYYYGTIGQDLIGRFREMTLNFKDMYIEFK